MAAKIDPSKDFRSVYIRVKNERAGGGPVPIRNWKPLAQPAEHQPRPHQRTGKDTGVI